MYRSSPFQSPSYLEILVLRERPCATSESQSCGSQGKADEEEKKKKGKGKVWCGTSVICLRGRDVCHRLVGEGAVAGVSPPVLQVAGVGEREGGRCAAGWFSWEEGEEEKGGGMRWVEGFRGFAISAGGRV